MKKILTVMMIVLVFICLLAPVVFAQDAKAVTASGDSSFKGMAVLAAALAIGIAAFGTGIAQGTALGKACEGAARNPGAANKIQTMLLIGLAMIESLCIYALIIAIAILYNQKLFFGL
jgi:F-type H+-transporting ATPase subunit c